MANKIIESLAELEKELGKEVQIKGIYRQINGAKRPGQFVASGRVSIQLASGEGIALDREIAGYRPKEEIAAMEGKEVLVKGVYAGWHCLWGDGTEASIVSHCLFDIKELRLAE